MAFVWQTVFQKAPQIQNNTVRSSQPKVTVSPVATAAIPNAINLLASESGGHVLVASSNDWAATIDGRESGKEISYAVGHSAVFAFKDERPATFDMFTMLIPGTHDSNVKEFELLQGNESPTGFFQSIGKFQTQNVKLFNTPYQEFKFSPVTAKYLEVKILSTFNGVGHALVYQFQLFGALQSKPPKVTVSPVATAAIPNAIDLLASENGGHVLVASSDYWARTINGYEFGTEMIDGVGQSAVFAFKDERPGTFDMFTMLITGTDMNNVKEFQLLQGNESPTGFFRSIGKFQTQNVKLFEKPYQEFKFSPMTAKYLKIKILSTWSGFPHPWVISFSYSARCSRIHPLMLATIPEQHHRGTQ